MSSQTLEEKSAELEDVKKNYLTKDEVLSMVEDISAHLVKDHAFLEVILSIYRWLREKPNNESETNDDYHPYDYQRDAVSVVVIEGMSKEVFGVELTYDQLARLGDEDVEKYCKMHEAFLEAYNKKNIIEIC